MMRTAASKALCLLVSVLFLLLAGCGKAENMDVPDVKRPTLTISLAPDTERYQEVQFLLDETSRMEMEETLGCSLRLDRSIERYGGRIGEGFGFSDVLLADDTDWMVSLSEHDVLKEFNANVVGMQEADSLYGRYGGRQYAYVFSKAQPEARRAALLVLPELLRQAGLSDIPYTPEGFRTALDALSQRIPTPLAVHGSPLSAGFTPVMALFGIAPSGGREFRLSGETVVYDKLEQQGRDYLAYINGLFLDGLIPKDFLSLSEYSAVDMLSGGRCAIAVFTSDACLQEAARKAAQQGRETAVIDLPVAQSNLEYGIYNRLFGVVSASCSEPVLADAFLQLLHMRTHGQESVLQATSPAKTYPLFVQECELPTIIDPVEQLTYDTRLQYEKNKLDEDIIDAFYCRMAVGSLPLDAFSDMIDQWHMKEDEESGQSHTIAKAYTRKYFTQFDG